jgi:hypothetical protein
LDALVVVTDDAGRVLSDVFMVLPSKRDYPDYYTVTQQPMAFRLIQKRLEQNFYTTFEAFEKDVKLIFDNAMYYNDSQSQIYADAVHLKVHFLHLTTVDADAKEQLQNLKHGKPTQKMTVHVKLPKLSIKLGSFSTANSSAHDLPSAVNVSAYDTEETAKMTLPTIKFKPPPPPVPVEPPIAPVQAMLPPMVTRVDIAAVGSKIPFATSFEPTRLLHGLSFTVPRKVETLSFATELTSTISVPTEDGEYFSVAMTPSLNGKRVYPEVPKENEASSKGYQVKLNKGVNVLELACVGRRSVGDVAHIYRLVMVRL